MSTSTSTPKMPPIEFTDYPSLAMGHEFSKTDLSIVGLDLQVFGLEEIKDSQKPIVALVATHGRMGSAKDSWAFSNGILGHTGTLRGENQKDLIIVTWDQRNHGTLLKNKVANKAFDQNPRHMVDMAATIVGGCLDTSLIMDFLAAYLFPYGERTIDEFAATGISLGGHVTWRLLQTDPRIRVGVPLIGLPPTSLEPCLRARALGLGLDWAPPLFPPSLSHLLTSPRPSGAYDGKRILTIHGGDDRLVPYSVGQEEITQIKEEVELELERDGNGNGQRQRQGEGGGKVVIKVIEGQGHVVTPDMVKMTAEFIWANCLTLQSRL